MFIFLSEPVTINKKRCERYASLPAKVKEQRNAKRRQHYQRKKVEKEASAAVAAQQHQEVTPVCQCKGAANLVQWQNIHKSSHHNPC
jgi:hypothetical protein